MLKKILYSFAIFISLLILVPVITLNIYLSILKHDVKEYLIEEKAYHKSDIQKVSGQIGKMPLLSVWVIFKDEPTVRYLYVGMGENSESKAFQLEYTVSKYGEKNNISHDDLIEEDLKHLEKNH